MNLAQLRRRIDRIDLKVLTLLNQRASLAQRVGRIKKRQGRPLFDGRREAQILRRLRQANAGPLPSASVAQIFQNILRFSRRLSLKENNSPNRR